MHIQSRRENSTTPGDETEGEELTGRASETDSPTCASRKEKDGAGGGGVGELISGGWKLPGK